MCSLLYTTPRLKEPLRTVKIINMTVLQRVNIPIQKLKHSSACLSPSSSTSHTALLMHALEVGSCWFKYLHPCHPLPRWSSRLSVSVPSDLDATLPLAFVGICVFLPLPFKQNEFFLVKKKRKIVVSLKRDVNIRNTVTQEMFKNSQDGKRYY